MNHLSRPFAIVPFLLVGSVSFADVEIQADERITLPGTASLGLSLDLDGERALVGEWGRAYAFESGPGGWGLDSELIPTSPLAGSQYGVSVALDGDRALVGASAGDGAVVVFDRIGGVWVETAVLTAPDLIGAGFDDRFGASMDIDPVMGRLVVGAPEDDTAGVDTGVVHIFESGPGGYSLAATISSPVPSYLSGFGTQVAIDGDTLAVSATGGVVEEVYLFSRIGGVWTHDTTLVGQNPTGSPSHVIGNFGYSLSLCGTTLAVGAPKPTVLGGAVIVFEEGGAGWSQTDYLVPSLRNQVRVGVSVALKGDVLIAPDFLGRVAFVYSRSASGRWDERLVLEPNDSIGSSLFGHRVAYDGTRVLVADPSVPVGADQGAFYAFERLDAPSFGVSYCHGDMLSNLCPCGWNSYKLAGPGCATEFSPGSRLVAGGSASLAAQDLSMEAFGMPPGVPALLFAGTQGLGQGIPFQDGLLCVGGIIRRFPGQAATPQGNARWQGVGSGLGALAPGDTRYFQVWYRVPTAKCGGAAANLSNGFVLDFLP